MTDETNEVIDRHILNPSNNKLLEEERIGIPRRSSTGLSFPLLLPLLLLLTLGHTAQTRSRTARAVVLCIVLRVGYNFDNWYAAPVGG